MTIYHKSVRKYQKKLPSLGANLFSTLLLLQVAGTLVAETELHLFLDCPRTQAMVREFVSIISTQLALATDRKLKFKHLYMREGSSDQPPYDDMLAYWLIMGYQPARIEQVMTYQDKKEPYFKDSKTFLGFLMTSLVSLTRRIRASKDLNDALEFQREMKSITDGLNPKRPNPRRR